MECIIGVVVQSSSVSISLFVVLVFSLVKSSQEFHYKNVLDLADDVSEEFKNNKDKDCF